MRKMWAMRILLLGLILLSACTKETSATAKAKRMDLKIVLTLEGSLQAYNYENIKPEMNFERQLTIKTVVANGTAVKKGELLVEFEDSELKADVDKAKLRLQQAKTTLIQSEEEKKKQDLDGDLNIRDATFKYDYAKMNHKKYVEIEGPKRQKELEMAIERAEANLVEQNKNLAAAKDLFKQDLVAESEVKKNELQVKEAQFQLDNSKKELDMFVTYTNPIEIKRLENDVDSNKKLLDMRQSYFEAIHSQQEANVANAESGLKDAESDLKKREDDFKKAKIKAPIAGVVNYGSPEESEWDRGRNQVDIKEGSKVSSFQTLMYIPDLQKMFVDLNIDEADLSKITIEESEKKKEDKENLAELDKIQLDKDLMMSFFMDPELMKAFQDPELQKAFAGMQGKTDGQKPKLDLSKFSEKVRDVVGVLTEIDWEKAGSQMNPDFSKLSVEDQRRLKRLVKKYLGAAARSFRPLKGEVMVEAIPNKTFPGEVEYVAGAGHRASWFEETTKFKVKFKMGELSEQFRPRMKANVKMFVDDVVGALCIPVDAVFKKDKKSVCYVRNGEGFDAREIRTGKSNNDFVEIVSGLNEGDEVALFDPTLKKK